MLRRSISNNPRPTRDHAAKKAAARGKDSPIAICLMGSARVFTASAKQQARASAKQQAVS